MTKNLIVRGFDDNTHAELSERAREKGVSINSIVKDAVDGWLQKEKKSSAPKKHHLIIYDNDDSIMAMLKSMDSLARDSSWYRCYIAPPEARPSRYLGNLGWFDGTILPYEPDKLSSPLKYCSAIIDKIATNAKDRPVCCTDFLINDIAKSSIKYALSMERTYDNDRIAGFMFCTYKTDTLLHGDISSMVELFELHDQVFIVRESDIYKLHITKESTHKFFLS